MVMPLSASPLRLVDGKSLRESFSQTLYLKFKSLFSEDFFEMLREEAFTLFEQHARRRDLIMQATQTPRHMSTVSGKLIQQHNGVIASLYANPQLLAFFTDITGDTILLNKDVLGRHVIHRLDRQGDTHGAHVDTSPYVLVICLESPGTGNGGGLEFVPFSEDVADLATSKMVSDTLGVGEAYFMKAGQAIHRVSPLTGDKTRTVIAFSYANNQTKDIEISYSSESLYEQ